MKLFKPLNNSKEHRGKLERFTEGVVTIKTDDGLLEIDRKNIGLIKTVYNWD
ncbi:MAG: hypothetical protein FWC68_03875 [Oscillospiraceae bacterium]|nr:hypothetical protein [Oscillospiraceae bacterium]